MSRTSLGSLYIDLLAKTGSFETDLGRAARIAEREAKRIERAIGAGAEKVTGAFKSLGAAAVGFAAAFVTIDAAFAQFSNAINSADQLDELSARLGISTEKLSAWGYAAKLSGTDLDTVGKSIPKLSKLIASSSDEASAAADLFRTLGISTKDAAGNLRDVEDVLPDIADRFQALQNDTLEQALAMELFGKSGAEMLEFLNRGSEGLSEFEERARALGIVIDGDTAQAAAQFNDQLDNLRAATQGLFTQIAAELLPAMTDLVNSMTEFARDADNARSAADGLGTTMSVLSEIGSAVVDIFQLVGYTIAGTAASAAGLFEVFQGLVQLDYGRIRDGFNLQIEGAKGAFGALFLGQDATGKSFIDAGKPRGSTRPALPEIDIADKMMQPLGVSAALESRLNRMFAGTPKPGSANKQKAAGKSDAERGAEQLRRAFESSIARQQESLALLNEELRTGGEVSELFRMRYELENGQLKGLNEAEKERLMLGAQQADDLKKRLELIAEEQKQADRYKGIAEDLRLEAEALGLSNLQLEVRNNLMRAGVTADSAEGMAIIAQTEDIDRLQRYADTMDNVRGLAENFLIDLPKSGKDAWSNLLGDLEQMLLQWAAKGIIQKVFGEFGTTGQGSAGGGWLASIFGSGGGTGGGGWGSILGSLFGGGRANGGPVMGGKFYQVNERGPELLQIQNRQFLMMPKGIAGRVTPMASGGGGVTQIVNQHYYGRMSRQTADQSARESGRAAQRAIRRNG